VAGAPGFVLVSGAVGGVPVAVGAVVCVVVWVVGDVAGGGAFWGAGGRAVPVCFVVD
jgi:hypothetical protein